MTENRHGLVMGSRVTPATGTAERDNAVILAAGAPYGHARVTVGGGKGFDTQQCVAELRATGSTPHVATYVTRTHSSALDGRTTRHPGYAISQWKRKQIEQVFGWLKTIGLCRQTRFRGAARGGWMVTIASAAYNLVRLRRVIPV